MVLAPMPASTRASIRATIGTDKANLFTYISYDMMLVGARRCEALWRGPIWTVRQRIW